jgi:aminopeptidase N
VEASKFYLDKMGADNAWAKQTRKSLEDMAWNGAVASKGNDNFQRRWFGLYVDVASTQEGLARLASLLDGKSAIDGLSLNQDLRWTIIRQLTRSNYQGVAALVEAEQARDKSDSGEAAALAATVARPDPQTKSEWLANVSDLQTKLPFSKVRTAMANMFPANQTALSEQSAAQRLAQLPSMDKSAGPVYMRAYAGTMIPTACTPASVERLANAAGKMQDLSAGTRRALQNALEEDQRCVTIRNAMTAPKS